MREIRVKVEIRLSYSRQTAVRSNGCCEGAGPDRLGLDSRAYSRGDPKQDGIDDRKTYRRSVDLQTMLPRPLSGGRAGKAEVCCTEAHHGRQNSHNMVTAVNASIPALALVRWSFVVRCTQK
jgi:hypothetical protein